MKNINELTKEEAVELLNAALKGLHFSKREEIKQFKNLKFYLLFSRDIAKYWHIVLIHFFCYF